jgi:sarcosine oxidase
MTQKADVAIVGLGAMGSAAAWQLAARGRKVIGFDRFRPPHGMGSSTGRSRIIREAYYESPLYVPLVRRAWELWELLERRSGRRLYRPTGGLTIGPFDGSMVQGVLATAEAYSLELQSLSAEEIADRFPIFRPDRHLTGLLESRAGVLFPEDCISAMLHEAEHAGATLLFDEPIERWESAGGGFVVRSRHGEYQADQIILAAGAWMATDLLTLRLPLTVARQIVFWMTPKGSRERFLADRCPLWLWQTRRGPVFYGFPDLGEGPKVGRHHGGPATTADAVQREVAAEESREVLAFLRGAVPGLAGAVADARVCLYTNTPDEHFILDQHPIVGGAWIASPCSGHGFKFAPVIGEILADLVVGKDPRFDLTPFRLNRFDPPR